MDWAYATEIVSARIKKVRIIMEQWR